MRILFLLLLLSALCGKAQFACEFKLMADTSLVGRSVKLTVFTVQDKNCQISKKKAKEILDKSGLRTAIEMTITDDYFVKQFKEICRDKKFKLDVVKVIPSRSKSGTADITLFFSKRAG